MTSPKTINYDAIFKELMVLREDTDWLKQRAKYWPERSGFIREHCTYWLGTPRQTGKTSWVTAALNNFNERLNDPATNSCMVVVNDNYRELLKNRGRVDFPIVTVKEIHDGLDGTDVFEHAQFDFFVVDEANYVMKRLKKDMRLFTWIAEHSTRFPTVLMIGS